jgi:hypothetical protein
MNCIILMTHMEVVLYRGTFIQNVQSQDKGIYVSFGTIKFIFKYTSYPSLYFCQLFMASFIYLLVSETHYMSIQHALLSYSARINPMKLPYWHTSMQANCGIIIHLKMRNNNTFTATKFNKIFRSLMTRTEMVLEMLVYSPFNHLMRLLGREYFTEYQYWLRHVHC